MNNQLKCLSRHFSGSNLIALDFVNLQKIKETCKYRRPSTPLVPVEERGTGSLRKRLMRPFVTTKRYHFPLVLICYDGQQGFIHTYTDMPLSTPAALRLLLICCPDGRALTFLSLTFGLGRTPVLAWSKGVLSSLSPRIEIRYWAMISCCSWEQWFSNDRITG